MYDIFLCDDDEFWIKHVRTLFDSVISDDDSYIFHSYTDISSFIQDMGKISKIDILLMDIQFPNNEDINGYDAAEIFRKHFSNAILIFCSGVYDITPKSLFHTPYRYIKKDMSDEEIIHMLSDTIRHLKERKPELCLPVYQGKDFISLSVDDITYIARNRGYCNVFLSEYAREKYNTDHMTARQSLSELQALLIPYHFSLPHNSYLVNLRYVWKSNYTTVVLQDKTELNISRSKVKKFREDILEYSTEKYRTGRL